MDQSQTNNRRTFLRSAVAIAATAASAKTLAATDHEHHHHHESNSNTELMDSALECVKVGEICRDHCITLVQHDDASIGDCLRAVNDMLPVCATLAKLAATGSTHLKAYAQVCADICKDCEKACKKHAKMHKACKACMDACADCIKACEKLSA